MIYERPSGGPLDYLPCQYAGSRLLFRGPRRARPDAATPHVVAIGGSETYGKFVATPWPALLEAGIGRPVLNLGCMNAGVDAFLKEPAISALTQGATLTLVQVFGAAAMSNRFYDVHPRRNDRFIAARDDLRALCPKMDFSEFNFIRHMLGALRRRAPEAYEIVTAELRTLWGDRMQALLDRIGGPAALVWIGDWRPRAERGDDLGAEPALVTPEMAEALAGRCLGLVRAKTSVAARRAGVAGMHFAPGQEAAAAALPGPAVHAEIAAAVLPLARESFADAPAH